MAGLPPLSGSLQLLTAPAGQRTLPPPHIGVRRQCGICSQLLQVGDPSRIVQFTSTGFLHMELIRERPFPHPEEPVSVNDGTVYYCTHSNCFRPCPRQVPATPVHGDCFSVVWDRLRRGGVDHQKASWQLWVEVSWQLPWPDRHPLYLTKDPQPSVWLGVAARRLGMPHLRALPWELVLEIWEHSQDSTFWRLLAACDLATELWRACRQRPRAWDTAVPGGGLVASWARGRGWGPGHSVECRPYTRFTIDARGIARIERLPSLPQLDSHVRQRANRTQRYIVARTDVLSRWEDKGYSEDGVLFLGTRLPRGVRVWDLRTPLPLTTFPMSEHMRTLDLRTVTGITFFCDRGHLHGIHGHTRAEPSAVPSFLRLPETSRSRVSWIYLPLPPNEQIVGVFFHFNRAQVNNRDPPSFFTIQTRLAGEVTVIYPSARYPAQLCRCMYRSPPYLLVYAEEVHSHPIQQMGVFPELRHQCSEVDRVRHVWTRKPLTRPWSYGVLPSTFAINHVAWAPLANVQVAHRFLSPETGHCRGLLFEYADGSQRALGDCRLGVDPTETCLRPKWIRFQHTQLHQQEQLNRMIRVGNSCTRHPLSSWCTERELAILSARSLLPVGLMRWVSMVEFDVEDQLPPFWRDWECYRAEGILEVWYERGHMELFVV